ncbi:hypothetical protein D6779_07270 [Candidatus Parcubacteria bacterium]|nr:MAG: hypothetical protein D6779_07270 [Candidatus Parcubacteria bacterium]
MISHTVYAFLPLTNFMGVVNGKLFRIPRMVISKRALESHQDRHPWFRWMDKISNRLSHVITANSMAVKKDVLSRDRIPEEKVRVIYNAIIFPEEKDRKALRTKKRRELGLNLDARLIVCVANLIPYKGHDILLKAFAALPEWGKYILCLWEKIEEFREGWRPKLVIWISAARFTFLVRGKMPSSGWRRRMLEYCPHAKKVSTMLFWR